MQTVFDAFLESARKYSDNDFLCVPASLDRHYYPEGRTWSYDEVADEVSRLQALYQQAGYGHGHRVALLLENRPEHFQHFLALNGLGVSIVPINPDYRHDEIFYLMEHSAAELVICSSARVPDMEAVAAKRNKLLAVVNGERLSAILPGPTTKAKDLAPDTTTEASLLYTSGTTGRPKGCILTNEYHLTAGRWYVELGGSMTMVPGQERVYNPLPLFHMNAGIVSFTGMMLLGGCVIVPDRFHPRSWWSEVAETNATIIHYLGVVPPILLNQLQTREEKQHRVRFGVGAGIEPTLHGAFEERFGFPLVEVWGMTETGRLLADNEEPRRIETRAIGRPIKELEARVVDENDVEVPRSTEGELVVRCKGEDPRKGFFAGYLHNEAATEEAWRGGWFHTGDVVRQDESDILYFVDRKKNIIRRSGENIAAAEVEACIQAHPKVAQVAVIPVQDELRQEEVMACVIALPGEEPGTSLAEDVFSWCMDRLAYFKAPGWITFVRELPTTDTQKVQKTKIFSSDVDPRMLPETVDLRGRKRRR